MALDKSVIKTIAAVAVAVVVVVVLLGVGLAIWLPRRIISLEYYPKPDGYSYDQSLIRFRSSDPASTRTWAARIDEFFSEYRGNMPEAQYRVDCSPHANELRGEEVCDVKIMKEGPCSPNNLYGYRHGTPCVFLRLTQRTGWIPEPYNRSYGLPPDMPDDLRMYIASRRSVHEANKVWITCNGENAADIENIGPVRYYPDRGLPAYYFPYTTRPGYLSPYVAVQFEKPATGVLINVECRAWAHNIQYDRYQRRGSVHFELMVDY